MHLLRIVLPDQPGMLGAVASALGKVNGDIVAVDVVERQGNGHAVDDFLVELPLGGRADELVSACQSVPDVRVVWLSRYGAGSDLRRDLEAVEAMTADPGQAERVLVDLAPGVFRGNWAMLLRRPSESGHEGPVEVRYATSAAPDLPGGDAPWVPVAKPTRLEVPTEWEEHGWRHVAAAAVPAGGKQVLVLGRTGGPPILESELARLGHLASLARTIKRSTRGV
ncbi:ACT domain-containing protein [Flindersiella endophytica]